MAKDLIIVESPAKVKTIKKILGSDYAVEASVGHIIDLPSKTIGVDEANNFKPEYQIIPGKEKVVASLEKAAAKAKIIYLAPDPDREGEAIGWHVAEVVRKQNKNIKRIQFNEITAKAVREALLHPRDLDENLFNAQQARRILDRLVGYKISPLLWQKVKRGISAGRVQSVALRLIVDREKERKEFKTEEYWVFTADLQAKNPPVFKAEIAKVNNKKPKISNAKEAETIENIIKSNEFKVSSVDEKERSREPQPPFITSTLQQIANQRLSYAAKRTMSIAQKLYEGLDIGQSGQVALITYMRTDSVRIADEAQKATRDFILKEYGTDYAPLKIRRFKSKSSSQDAHEAIRPIDVTITPESIKAFLNAEQYQIYKLIWSRFVASQMAAARFHDTNVLIKNGAVLWKAKGERLLFPGFLTIFGTKEEEFTLPPLESAEVLNLLKLNKEQKFTQPPARYSEASLVHELEERGIGRPSTYAAIISTLLDREYAELQDKKFVPTDLGTVVCELLVQHFNNLMDVNFTANMENSLDKVADGQENWVNLLSNFSAPFNETLQQAAKAMKTIKTGLPSGLNCPKCDQELTIKFGKAGSFLACSAYPNCDFTSNFKRNEQGQVQIEEKQVVEREIIDKCPNCSEGNLVIKQSRAGSKFIACDKYPACTYTKSFSTNVHCPRENCPGSLVEKSSKRGKIFYACDQYPKCDCAFWDLPINETCPECGSKILLLKNSKAGKKIICPGEKCKYSRKIEE